MEFITALVAFGCVFLFVLGVGMLLQPNPAGRRLAHLASKRGPVPTVPQESLVRGSERGVLGVFSRIGKLREGADVRARFVHAGFGNPSAPAIYYGIRISLALGLPLVAGLVSVAWVLPAIQEITLLLAAAAVGYLAPSGYLDRRVTRRKGAISRTLPDAPSPVLGDWLYFIIEDDLRRDDNGDPVRAYDYEHVGFYSDAALTNKVGQRAQ